MCTWWQVYSALVNMVVYQISKVCLVLMYMQHNNMAYGELDIYPYLVLDKNANDNSYPTSLRHKVWNMDQKVIRIGIDLCYNNYSHLCVQLQHYLEHDNFCLSILFSWIVFLNFPWSMASSLRWFFARCSWNYLDKLTSFFWVPVWIWISESNIFDPGSWKVNINWYM